MSNPAYEATGIDALVTVTFGALPGASTLTGGAVAVDAINLETKIKVPGTATIASATTIRCIFGPWILAAGIYAVHTRAQPLGYSEQTVSVERIVVEESAAETP